MPTCTNNGPFNNVISRTKYAAEILKGLNDRGASMPKENQFNDLVFAKWNQEFAHPNKKT